jgi:glycolate oxidase
MMVQREHSAETAQDFAGIDRAALLADLARSLPAAALLSADEDLKPYECDGLSAYRQVPVAVALPETEAQVAAVIKACRAAGVPVVARGAGTGLSGGALPHTRGVVLSLARFNRILRRSRGAHRRGAAGRAQPGDLRGGRAARPVLRARSVLADRLLDRRQRGRELRRRALPQVRPDGAQRAARARP